ncbi:MAG: hypothetical protein VX938_09410, partial [Myxococcota bacterium]|nr:hypothetical protein [Myxococcota bacterium]
MATSRTRPSPWVAGRTAPSRTREDELASTTDQGAGTIEVRGARQNNLADVDVTVPRGKLSVVTGVSGSGKSSLAFQTLYAEGQRRYV